MVLPRHSLCGAIGFGAACLASSGVFAQDAPGGVRLVFGVEQSIETGRNFGLTVPDEGSSTIAATTLSFGLSSQSALDLLEITGSTAFLVEDTPDTDGVDTDLARPALGLSYTREVPNALFGVDLRFISDDVDRLAEDLADANAIGTQTEYGIALRFETGRTGPASFFANAAYDVLEYEDTIDPDLRDTRTTTIASGTRLRLSEVMLATIALGFTREDEDGDDDTTDTLLATFGLDYTMANGSASLMLGQSSEDGGEHRTTLEVGRSLDFPTGALSARLGVSRSDLGETDLIGGIDWNRTLPDGEITVSLSRSSSYDNDLDETTVDTDVAVDWRHDFTSVSSVEFNVSWAESDAPSERVEETEFAATYSHALNADWRLDSGIRYRVRNDLDGRATSPSVFLSVGRSFFMRP